MSYLLLNGEKLNQTIERIESIIDFQGQEFDTIAVRGNSGVLVGGILAREWDKDLIIVRKEGENSHGMSVEGWGHQQKILILDDFVETGRTMRIIYKALMKRCDNPTIIGILLYGATRHTLYEDKYEVTGDTYLPLWQIGKA